MKESIAIIGAGQAGLQLGIKLVKVGFNVDLFSNRSAEEIFSGKILSSQGMFGPALEVEKDLELNYWEHIAPKNKAVTFTLVNPSKPHPILKWQGHTQKTYQSIDQRIKFPRWIKEFEKMGGNFIIEDVNLDKLNKITKWHDLTVVAGGKGEITQTFPVDKEKSVFTSPPRKLSCLYLKNVVPVTPLGVKANIFPGIGEIFIMPGFSHGGLCEMPLIEAIPGGAFDCWEGIKHVDQQFEVFMKLLKKYLPWESERFIHAEPVDKNAGLMGAYTPVVRHPTFELPCGKSILGIGDTVVLNDPIAGQGANNACMAAHIYSEEIIKNTGNTFDQQWMKDTFNLYWNNYGKWATHFSNLLLNPPPAHFITLLHAASEHPMIANMLSNAFAAPKTLYPWINDPESTYAVINDMQKEHSVVNTYRNQLVYGR